MLLKNLFKPVSNLLLRLRYPCSTPEDVARDLGVELSNSLSFEDLTEKLTCPDCLPSKLYRFMPREQAEKMFTCALRKEHFSLNSIFSYYFQGSWLEFVLYFDGESRLRRLYIRHRTLNKNCEMSLSP